MNKESIKETVNKHIEKHQFPTYRQHPTLLGWANMNYSSVIQNPMLKIIKKNQDVGYEQTNENIQNKLKNLYQVKNQEQPFALVKPFTTAKMNAEEQKRLNPNIPEGFKLSLKSLTTTNRADIANIHDNLNHLTKEKDFIFPQNCLIGTLEQDQFLQRKNIPIGKITYNPQFENETVRHLQKLPNSIITEQSLIEILNDRLEYLNLANHTWIPIQLINKIGHLAPNIKIINLSYLEITDNVIIELKRSLEHLSQIDISNCSLLTEDGISKFLEKTDSDSLTSFISSNNPNSITDASLKHLGEIKNLSHLDVSFCKKLTDEFITPLLDRKNKFQQLDLSALENLTIGNLSQLIQKNNDTLEVLNLGFMTQKEFKNEIMANIASCSKLNCLNLSGCQYISDMGVMNLCKGNGFPALKKLKFSGMPQIGESCFVRFIQQCQNLELLEANGMINLGDQFLQLFYKEFPNIKTIIINQTPGISQQAIQELLQNKPKINCVRQTIKSTDPKDDGLRIPYVPIKKVLAPAKKKKKDGKKK